jgi:outer membrane protein assembly factor BamA
VGSTAGEDLMRTAVGCLFCSWLGLAALAQAPAGPLDVQVQVRTLSIVSNDVPQLLQKNIVLAFQGKTYSLEELEERIRQNLRDMGYANAGVELPQLASMPIPSPGQAVDVTVQISAGAIYRLGAITFTGNRQITNIEALRAQFPLKDGDVFNATAIGKGLDALKNAYQALGYANFGAIPKLQYDEAQHTVTLTIDIQEGKQYLFGRLLLDGVEPHPGMIEALETAWKPLENGGVYSPRLLSLWLGKNAAFIPDAQTMPERYVSLLIDDDGGRVNVQLEFPAPVE